MDSVAVSRGGNVTSPLFSSWLPSARAMFMCSGLKSPAVCFLVPAPKLGANGRPASVFRQLRPPGAALSLKSPDHLTAELRLQGVITFARLFGPQEPGLVRG